MPIFPPQHREHGQGRKGGGHPVGLNSGPKRVGQIKEENRQAKTQRVPQGQRTGFIHRRARCHRVASQSPETYQRQNDPHQEHRIHEPQGGRDEFGQELRPETPRLIQAAPLLQVGHGDPTVATIPKNHRQDRRGVHGQGQPRPRTSQVSARRRMDPKKRSETGDEEGREVLAQEGAHQPHTGHGPPTRAIFLESLPTGDHGQGPKGHGQGVHGQDDGSNGQQRHGGQHGHQEETRAPSRQPRHKPGQSPGGRCRQHRSEESHSQFAVAPQVSPNPLRIGDERRFAVIGKIGVLRPKPLVRLVFRQFDDCRGQIAQAGGQKPTDGHPSQTSPMAVEFRRGGARGVG